MKHMKKLKFCMCGCGTKITHTDKYGRKHKYVSGHNGRKYEDPTQYKREWNKRNKKQRTDYRRNKRQERKGILIEYKGGLCEDCSLNYNGKNGCVFDFHHIKDKEFNISGNVMEKSMEKLKKEADKCMLLCGNCHRQKHSDKY